MLISLSQAIEPVGPVDQCDARPTVTFPANGRYQFILLGEQRHTVCEQLAQGRCRESGTAGIWTDKLLIIAFATCKSHAVFIKPPCHTCGAINSRQSYLSRWDCKAALLVALMGMSHDSYSSHTASALFTLLVDDILPATRAVCTQADYCRTMPRDKQAKHSDDNCILYVVIRGEQTGEDPLA